MKFLLRRILPALLAILLLLLVVLTWLVATEAGLRVLWQRLLTPAVPELAAVEVRGRLLDSITLRDLRYETDQLLFSAHSLQLDWTPRGLLDGVVQIRRLAAEGLRYEQRGQGSDEPTVLPVRIALPVAIELAALTIQDGVLVSAPGAEPLAIESLSLAGAWRETRLDITRLALRRPDLRVDGAATLHAQEDYPLSGELRMQVTPPGYAPLQGETRLSGSLRRLQLEQTVAPPYALQASVLLGEPLTDLVLEASIRLQDSDLPAISTDWPAMRLAGTVSARGPLDELQLDGRVDIRDAMAATLQLVFAGMLRPDALQLDTLQLESPGRPSRLDAHGTVGLGAQPTFDFRAVWQSLAWPLEGDAEYASKQGRFTLTGTPNDYRLDASGDVRYRDLLDGQLAVRARSADEPGSWRVETATLSRGNASVMAAGQIGSRYDLDWRVNAPSLTELSPQASGSLRGSGRLVGRLPAVSISVQAQGKDVGFQQHRIGTLALDGEIRLDDERPSRLQATLGEALLAGTRVSRLALNGSGTTGQHGLALVLESDRGMAELDATGRWDGTTWRFTVQQATLTYPQLPSWSLEETLGGELSGAAGLRLGEHCWVSGEARACGRFAGTAAAYDGRFTLTQVPLAPFTPLLPGKPGLEGTFQAHAEIIKPPRGAVRVDVNLESTPVSVQLPRQDSPEPWRLDLAPGAATFSLTGTRALLSLDLPFAATEGGMNAQLQMGVPADGDWLQGRLDGEVALLWPDIAPAANWLPEVDKLSGRLDGRMQVSGTPAAPQLLGRLALIGGGATLLTPGLVLEEIDLELIGQPTGEVRVAAALRSGGGTLNGEGMLNPLERTAALTLRGDQFQVMNLPEAQIFASPDLQLAMDSRQVTINGQIDVPRAQLRPRKLPASAVGVSADQVLVTGDAGDDEAQAPYAVTARIRVVLGEAVDIDGFGLSGNLRGDVLLVDLPAQPASATGEVSISDGRYDAYGQKLSIRTGRLLFAGGAVTKPGLDIEAVRKPAPDVLVGVRVRGTIRAPRFTVFSEPSMPQSAQLSWLVLGRPLERGASDSERSTMQAAALMLGMSGGESFGKAVGEQLGLDEVTIGTPAGEDETQASLLVGKYLTPELFVSYGIGLFEPITTLRLRYTLSSRWKLVGEASALSSSADLIYEIERR